MKGLNPFPASPAEFRENLRVETEVLEELYFRPTFYAGDGLVASGALLSCGVVPGSSSVEFPAAGTPVWRIERRRRARWQAATVRVTITYTAIAGSVNPFVFNLRTREYGPGDVLATANILAVRLVLPGPAVANTVMEFVSAPAATAINGAKANMMFTAFRDKTDAGDTNANSLHVLSMQWEILPV